MIAGALPDRADSPLEPASGNWSSFPQHRQGQDVINLIWPRPLPTASRRITTFQLEGSPGADNAPRALREARTSRLVLGTPPPPPELCTQRLCTLVKLPSPQPTN